MISDFKDLFNLRISSGFKSFDWNRVFVCDCVPS